jgi:flagellar motor switch protein FliM
MESPAVVSVNYRLIDVLINLLYGGTVDKQEETQQKIGKNGLIAAEKINQIMMDCMVAACKEHGEFITEEYKTSVTFNTICNIPNDEPIFSAEFKIQIDEIENIARINLTEEFLIKLIPIKTRKAQHKEKDFWRSAIKSEVMDSFVTITTNMNDLKMSVKDFMALNEGDEIEIGDPTVVFVCLNDLKLYRALAGQSNSKLVVKVVGQV